VFATIRFPARSSIGRIYYRAWFSRMINVNGNGRSKRTKRHAVRGMRDRKLAARWTKRRPSEGLCYREQHSGREFIDEESSLIVWKIQFSIFHDGTRDWPYLRLLFLSNRRSFVRLLLSRLPRGIVSTLSLSLSLLPLPSAGCTEDSCKLDLTLDQQRLLIRCQELYLKIRRSSINLRSRQSFLRERDWSAWKFLILPRCWATSCIAEMRVKEKPRLALLLPSIPSFFDPHLHLPFRLDTREYI